MFEIWRLCSFFWPFSGPGNWSTGVRDNIQDMSEKREFIIKEKLHVRRLTLEFLKAPKSRDLSHIS